MQAMERYFNEVRRVLDTVWATQRDAMAQAAEAIANATRDGRSVFAFGCSHAGLLAMELFYRTGGMATINPVRAPGMMCELTPITMTSEMERMEHYGDMILRNTPAAAGDVLLIHSVSGRNAVSVDMAAEAKRMGLTLIVLTNMQTTRAVSSRHSSGKKLCDFADILIDNCGCVGDASIALDGLPERVAPTSTAVGAAICNAIVAEAMERMLAQGLTPPVFVSANLEQGDAHNRAVLEQYRSRIYYM